MTSFIRTNLSRSAQFSTETTQMAPERFSYPNVRRDESAITDYHGTKISDPYIWLEDPDTKETEVFC